MGRWRPQQTARRHVNCKPHDHRHVERILHLIHLVLLWDCIRYIWLSVVISLIGTINSRAIESTIQCLKDCPLMWWIYDQGSLSVSANHTHRHGHTLIGLGMSSACSANFTTNSCLESCTCIRFMLCKIQRWLGVCARTTLTTAYLLQWITIIERPQLMCDYPLNLSILIRGGKETKWDSLSSGERNGISPARRVVGLNAYWPVPCKGGSISCAYKHHIQVQLESGLIYP